MHKWTWLRIWRCLQLSLSEPVSPFPSASSRLPSINLYHLYLNLPLPLPLQRLGALPRFLSQRGQGYQQKTPASSGSSEHLGCQMCFQVPRTVGLRSSIILYPTIILMGEKPTYLDAPRQYAKSLLLEWQQRQCLSGLDLVVCFEWIEFYRKEEKEWWSRCCACIRLWVCFPTAQKERKSGGMGHP